MNILYFGCLGSVGHYLHDKVTGSQGWKETFATPWGKNIGGGMLEGKPYNQGVVYFEQRGGWSAIDFCDYSVDRRPGSHSMFLVDALISRDELISEAMKVWPQVFERFKFGLILQ